MRAVAIAEDRTLQPVELEERPLGPREARVEVAFCGICGSDIHFRASSAIPPGTVMGHEFSGKVSELGAEVDPAFSVGDRVAVYPFAPCGECANCRRGDLHVCQEAAVKGLGLGMNEGAYAESVVVEETMLLPIPSGLSFEHAALIEPLAVGLHGISIGETTPADSCVVIGAGPIGVMTALGLKARGVERVLVVEKNAHRQGRIRSFGFEAIGLDQVHDRVLEEFDGAAPDVVLECAGNPAAPQLAIELVRHRGIIVLLGVLEEPVPISQLVLLIKEAQLRSSFAYRKEEFAEAVSLLAAGKLPAARLITHKAPLEEAQAMFDLLSDPETEQIKVLLSPGIS
jgi:(R,R)-butanediol dehydrogenase/meso-butanediol dehydrogenase/diacetyl reductase